MAGCIVRQLLFCTFVYTCYTSHYNKRLLTYLLICKTGKQVCGLAAAGLILRALVESSFWFDRINCGWSIVY